MVRWLIDGPQKLTFDEPVDRLDVRLVAGRINVVGADGPARLEVTRVDRFPLHVEHRDGRLVIRHERRRRFAALLWPLSHSSRRFRTEISVVVPVGTRLDLDLASGSVIVTGIGGATDVDVISGYVTLMGLCGPTSAKVLSGSVEVLGASGDLTVETVSGEVIIADSSAGRVDASTVSGAITCDLDNPHNSAIRLATASGNVTIRIREDSDLTVRLGTTSGRITSGFAQLVPVTGIGVGQTCEGVLGTGLGRLDATAISGSVALLARVVDDDPVDHVPADDGAFA